MLVAVIILLRLDRGLMRAWMFMGGRLVAYVGWCTVLFIFADRFFNLTLDGPPVFILLLKAILGMLLIAMAIKIALGGNDPEAIPSKIVEMFTGISLVQLFALGVLVSLFQVRHIMLLFLGVTEIIIADLSIVNRVLATIMLIVIINVSQLILIGIYLTLGDQADMLVHSFDVWLNQNNRRISALIGLIGVFLLWDGITGLVFFQLVEVL